MIDANSVLESCCSASEEEWPSALVTLNTSLETPGEIPPIRRAADLSGKGVMQLHEPMVYGAVLKVNCRRLENVGSKFLPILRLSEDGMAQGARSSLLLPRLELRKLAPFL